ncbi:PAS domain S-box protein [Aggregicoccus sp. 17bor-14]|uniref:sensor histidine kinase n=1 Tax=Myxococcaceae TaxID=31 RepID=UPI00129D16E4|nr:MULTISPECIES: ATP-binding protein [Myxococcaceae]MBF5043549.1 PAS domain S-box protein [Simulacricoccus sp. 17bor-14]MRI89308.1 PAS domain S-box protein [Aggregicoccus sp. 17bor-14]
MQRSWSSARRLGVGLTACVLAGVVILVVTLLALRAALWQGPELARLSLELIVGLAAVGLAGATALGLLLRRAFRQLYRDLQESEQRFRLFVDGVRDYALCVLDAQGCVTEWNAGAERISGWSPREVTGRPRELFHTQAAVADGLPQAQLLRAARLGRLHAEEWRVRRDGTRYWAETLLTALRDARGNLQGFAELTRDITERRRVERAQHLFAEAGRVLHPALSVAQLHRALTELCVPELADACVLHVPGEDGRARAVAFRHAQPGLHAQLESLVRRLPCEPGVSPGAQAVLDTGCPELLSPLDPEDLPAPLRATPLGELLQGLQVRALMTVPLAVGERVLGALSLYSSDPHRSYSELDLHFTEELGARAALALENARLLGQAQAALELIGVAAHDLGNPLLALQLKLRRLRMGPGAEAPVREGLAGAERQARTLGQMMWNLLDLSRLSANRLSLEPEPLELGALVREVADRFQDQAQEAGCALSVRVEGEVHGVWDRMRLDRVVTNLLSNALKFGRGAPVQVGLSVDGALARLSVQDGGCGIPPEAQERIFHRFERVTGERAQAGFGLGLYIVRELVEAHGGSIRVASEPGRGARFTVELPGVVTQGLRPTEPRGGAALHALG